MAGRTATERADADAGAPALWTRPFLLVCSLHLLAYGSYAAVNPTLSAYLDGLTGSETLIGAAMAAFTLSAVVARPIGGWLLDRHGRRAVQAVAVLGFGAATLAYQWVGVIWSAIVLRSLHGVAWGVSTTATTTLAADVVPADRRTEGLAHFGVVPNLAILVGPAAGLWLAHRWGFAAQFTAAALLAGAAAVALVGVGETHPPTTGDDRETKFVAAGAALPAAFVVFTSVPFGALDALLVLYAPTVGLANAGAFYAAMGAAVIPARLALGRLADAARPGLVLVPSFVLQAVALLVLGLAPRFAVVAGRPAGVLVAAALFGAGYALVFPTLQAVAVAAVADEHRGAANGTVLVGMDVGVAAGAVGFGALAGRTSLQAVYPAAALVPLAGVVALVAAGDRLTPDAAAQK